MDFYRKSSLKLNYSDKYILQFYLQYNKLFFIQLLEDYPSFCPCLPDLPCNKCLADPFKKWTDKIKIDTRKNLFAFHMFSRLQCETACIRNYPVTCFQINKIKPSCLSSSPLQLLKLEKRLPYFTILAAVVEDRILSVADLKAAAELPSLDLMRATLVQSLGAHSQNLTRNLAYHQVRVRYKALCYVCYRKVKNNYLSSFLSSYFVREPFVVLQILLLNELIFF